MDDIRMLILSETGWWTRSVLEERAFHDQEQRRGMAIIIMLTSGRREYSVHMYMNFVEMIRPLREAEHRHMIPSEPCHADYYEFEV